MKDMTVEANCHIIIIEITGNAVTLSNQDIAGRCLVLNRNQERSFVHY